MRWWQNEMWRQLACNVKISLGLLNVHLCFAVGRNIYDYGGKTVLAVRQFLLLHSPRCTIKRDSRNKSNIISRKAIYRKILHRPIILQTRHCDVICSDLSNVKTEREKGLNGFNIDMHTKKSDFYVYKFCF